MTKRTPSLHEKVEELRRFASEDRSDTFIKRGDSLPLFSPSSSPYKVKMRKCA